MKLTTTTNVSVDGVMQGLGGPEEDRSGGFERGGWAIPLFDNEAATFLNEVYQRADAFLFGRRTYEIFAGYWGVVADPSINPIAAALNTKPKHVASNTLTDPQWADTTVLSGDVAAAVGELKAKPGGELQVHGSGSLVRWLLENDLVDEITLLTYPVVVGQGGDWLDRQGNALRLGGGESLAGDAVESFDPAGPQVGGDALVSSAPEPLRALVAGQEGKGTPPVKIQRPLQSRREGEERLAEAGYGPVVVEEQIAATPQQDAQLGDLFLAGLEFAEV